MGKAYYVKFETPEDLVNPILDAVRVASTSGKVELPPLVVKSKEELMRPQRQLNVAPVN
jgi:hypothetical protein